MKREAPSIDFREDYYKLSYQIKLHKSIAYNIKFYALDNRCMLNKIRLYNHFFYIHGGYRKFMLIGFDFLAE